MDRDTFSLAVEASCVLRSFRALLAHPGLDLSPTERERYEQDWCGLSIALYVVGNRAEEALRPLPYARPVESTDTLVAPF